MIEYDYELSVGDTIQLGEHIVTVTDIDGPAVRFRLEEEGEATSALAANTLRTAVPR